MKEKVIERKLVTATKAKGGIAPKFVSPGYDGMPDRIILMPNGKMGFVELKAKGKKPRPIQEARHKLLRELGFRVYVVNDVKQIDGVLGGIENEQP